MSIKTARLSLILAWVIALTALIATIYSSEVVQLPVCHLCWYQRIALYPLSIILFIAAFRDDFQIGIYAIPLAIIAACFAAYQYLIQMIPNFGPINFCMRGPECNQIHIKLLGFITFPFLSLVASLLIAILLLIAYFARNQNE